MHVTHVHKAGLCTSHMSMHRSMHVTHAHKAGICTSHMSIQQVYTVVNVSAKLNHVAPGRHMPQICRDMCIYMCISVHVDIRTLYQCTDKGQNCTGREEGGECSDSHKSIRQNMPRITQGLSWFDHVPPGVKSLRSMLATMNWMELETDDDHRP